MGRDTLRLAKERLSLAEHAFSQGLYNTMASELYFALFILMRAVLTEIEAKRWKNTGIFSEFSRMCIDKKILDKRKY